MMRFNCDFGSKDVERIKRVRAFHEAPTNTSVVRKGLRVLDHLTMEEAKGGKLYLEYPDGRRAILKFLQ